VMKPLYFTLSIFAGLLGGFVSQYLFPAVSVHAQSEPSAPKTIEAGTFRLVNHAGHLAGTLTINAHGDGVITMFDADGKAIFTSAEKPIVKPAIAR
jgi:hypothetical protein